MAGRRGRPRLALPDGVLIAQVVKQYARRRVVGVVRRAVQGTAAAIQARAAATQGWAAANTACIERLIATFRARLAPLVRRTRAGARLTTTVEAGMWLRGRRSLDMSSFAILAPGQGARPAEPTRAVNLLPRCAWCIVLLTGEAAPNRRRPASAYVRGGGGSG